MSGQPKPTLDAQRKWRYMIPISHQFYIYGRQAAEDLMGTEEVARFVERFWRIAGEDTGRMYVDLGNLTSDDLPGLVRAISRSSEIMGEDAEARLEGGRAFLIHYSCPWPEAYKKYGLPESCQGGCDIWFQTLASVVSPKFKVKTSRSIPAGEALCVREFRVED
jgi:hypothetical protein